MQPGSSSKCWGRNPGRFWKQRWQEREECSPRLGHSTWTECTGTLFHFYRSHVGEKANRHVAVTIKAWRGWALSAQVKQSILRERSLFTLLLFQIFMGMSECFCMECSPKLLKTFRAGAWLHLPPSVNPRVAYHVSRPYWAGALEHLYLCGCQWSLFLPPCSDSFGVWTVAQQQLLCQRAVADFHIAHPGLNL